MTIETNIQGVIDRMKRKPRNVRTALTRTLAVGEWDKLLRAEAKCSLIKHIVDYIQRCQTANRLANDRIKPTSRAGRPALQ